MTAGRWSVREQTGRFRERGTGLPGEFGIHLMQWIFHRGGVPERPHSDEVDAGSAALVDAEEQAAAGAFPEREQRQPAAGAQRVDERQAVGHVAGVERTEAQVGGNGNSIGLWN